MSEKSMEECLIEAQRKITEQGAEPDLVLYEGHIYRVERGKVTREKIPQEEWTPED